MKLTNELISNDLYSSEKNTKKGYKKITTPENKITYEEIYWVLLTGFGLLIGCSFVLLSYLF